MPGYKITLESNQNDKLQVGVCAESLTHLKKQVQEKFNLPQGPLNIFLEDGTLVCDEEYFKVLEPQTKFRVRPPGSPSVLGKRQHNSRSEMSPPTPKRTHAVRPPEPEMLPPPVAHPNTIQYQYYHHRVPMNHSSHFQPIQTHPALFYPTLHHPRPPQYTSPPSMSPGHFLQGPNMAHNPNYFPPNMTIPPNHPEQMFQPQPHVNCHNPYAMRLVPNHPPLERVRLPPPLVRVPPDTEQRIVSQPNSPAVSLVGRGPTRPATISSQQPEVQANVVGCCPSSLSTRKEPEIQANVVGCRPSSLSMRKEPEVQANASINSSSDHASSTKINETGNEIELFVQYLKDGKMPFIRKESVDEGYSSPCATAIPSPLTTTAPVTLLSEAVLPIAAVSMTSEALQSESSEARLTKASSFSRLTHILANQPKPLSDILKADLVMDNKEPGVEKSCPGIVNILTSTLEDQTAPTKATDEEKYQTKSLATVTTVVADGLPIQIREEPPIDDEPLSLCVNIPIGLRNGRIYVKPRPSFSPPLCPPPLSPPPSPVNLIIIIDSDSEQEASESIEAEQLPESVEAERPPDPESVEAKQPPEPESVEAERPPEPESVEAERPPEPESAEAEQPPEPESVEAERPPEPESVEPERPPEPESAEAEQPPEPESVEAERPPEPESVEAERPPEPESAEAEQPPESAESKQPPESAEPTEPEIFDCACEEITHTSLSRCTEDHLYKVLATLYSIAQGNTRLVQTQPEIETIVSENNLLITESKPSVVECVNVLASSDDHDSEYVGLNLDDVQNMLQDTDFADKDKESCSGDQLVLDVGQEISIKIGPDRIEESGGLTKLLLKSLERPQTVTVHSSPISKTIDSLLVHADSLCEDDVGLIRQFLKGTPMDPRLKVKTFPISVLNDGHTLFICLNFTSGEWQGYVV